MFRKLFISSLILFCTSLNAFSAQAWINDSRKLFQSNGARIYAINLRTFNAQDLNKDGIIEFSEGEEGGTFLNAIARLDEIQSASINTIHVLPITSIGKTKALGTAGSLYSALSFNELNPQLVSQKSALGAKEQAQKFIDEAHKRGIRVVVDLPSCGSYDLYMKRPEIFIKDKTGQPVIPADWTDVRLLDAGTNEKVNLDVYNMYKEFVDLMISLNVDGIRADVAPSKPYKFWKDLIDYSRKQDPQFLWIAEASDSWNEPISKYAVFTPYNKLLEAGFDGFYGSWFNLKDWKTSKQLMDSVKKAKIISKSFSEPKSEIASFTTHDELSPLLINGETFSEMIIWLNATLPINSYFVDGFSTGDSYVYFWANKKAQKTYTDDEYYFVHRGKIDIFNFSRKPGGTNEKLYREFVLSNGFKNYIMPIINNGKFTQLRTSAASVFGYAWSYNKTTIIVMGNLDFKEQVDANVYVPGYKEEMLTVPVKMTSSPISGAGKFKLKIYPGEVQVLLINNFEIK